jgi:hypothetical protein
MMTRCTKNICNPYRIIQPGFIAGLQGLV